MDRWETQPWRMRSFTSIAKSAVNRVEP